MNKLTRRRIIMSKRYANFAFIYAIAAMAFGVFYREFTKFNGFTGDTRLSVIHTHYFLLGMVFFLILMLIEKNFALTQVLADNPEKALDASIAGISGTGHIVMGVSLGVLLFKIKKAAVNNK